MRTFFSDPVDQASSAAGYAADTLQGASVPHQPIADQRFPMSFVVLGAAVAAGVISIILGELVVEAYRADLLPRLRNIPDPEDMRRFKAARVNSPAITFAILGGTLGLAMGLVGGLLGRSAATCARSATLGLVLGVIGGGATAWGVATAFFLNHDPQSTDLMFPLLCHALIWLTIASASGLALGVGLGGSQWTKTVTGAVAGAAIATIVYEVAGALAFPTSKTDLPLSASLPTRILAQTLVVMLSSQGALLAIRSASRSSARVS